MANKEKGEVSLSIDGKEYSIKLRSELFATAEDILGVDSLIGRPLGFRSIRVLFFLSCQDQGINSIDEVSKLMDKYMIPITEAVKQAVDFFYLNQVQMIDESGQGSTES